MRSPRILTATSPVARKRIAIGVAVIAIVASTATATTVVADTDDNARIRGVVLFAGDSNVTISAAQIVWRTTLMEHFDDPYIPVMASRVGATIRTHDCIEKTGCRTYNYWQIKLRDTLSRISPDAIVNNLGINDTVVPGTEATPGYAYYGRKIDWFMRLTPKGTPVFWTNLPCALLAPVRQKGCKAVNKALAAAPQRWPKFVLVNWAARASGHPEYFVRHPSGKKDVHHSAAGSTQWIKLVTERMDARLPSN